MERSTVSHEALSGVRGGSVIQGAKYLYGRIASRSRRPKPTLEIVGPRWSPPEPMKPEQIEPFDVGEASKKLVSPADIPATSSGQFRHSSEVIVNLFFCSGIPERDLSIRAGCQEIRSVGHP